MPPRLHFILLRFAPYPLLLLGLVLTYCFWVDWQEKAFLAFLLPGFFLFFFVPLLFRRAFHACCPSCNCPVRISEKKRDNGFREYIYRCRSCTHQHQTGVGYKSNRS